MAGETCAQNLNDYYCQVYSEKYKTTHKTKNPQKPWDDQPTKCFSNARSSRHRKNDCERKPKTDKQ